MESVHRNRRSAPQRVTPYAHLAWTFSERARKLGLLPSMGTVGDCYVNAMMEAFWSRMQVELLDSRRWKTRVELANAIFEYLEIFHNRRRAPLGPRHADTDRI
jgi:transposase InsO family protein